jgi:Tol biopolymer transport system component
MVAKPKEITFHSFRSRNRDVFVMNADGTSLQQVTSDQAQERFQDWSADGNRIVFHSDKTGRQELYVTSRVSKTSTWQMPVQLTFDVGDHPRWSPDGSLVAYLCLVDSSLRVIAPESGEPKILVRSRDATKVPVPVFVGWSADSRTVYYKAFDAQNQTSFWSVPVTGGVTKLLVKFDDPAKPSHRPEFSTDGRKFYFRVADLESDIWVMDLQKNE